MAKKNNTKTSKMLMYLLAAKKDFEAVFPAPGGFVKDSLFSSYGEFKNMVYHLRRQKWVEIVKKNNERFIKLTRHGEIEALLAKARLPSAKGGRWDGKWRIVMFDIPQESSPKRDLLRRLLKENGFLKLQGSVFISPSPLNREALTYLRESELINYVRIIKAEEIDDDSDLRKRFQLPAFS